MQSPSRVEKGNQTMKKWVVILLICAAVLLGIGAKVGYDWYQNNTYIIMEDRKLPRDITELDCSGKPVAEPEKLRELTQLQKLDLRNTGLTVAQYEQLQAALPQCRILWSVPFRDGYLELDTEALSLTGLTEADVAQLGYLEKLQKLEVTGCQDYELLEKLKVSRPELDVAYTVLLGEGEYSNQVTELVLEHADPEQVSGALPYLKNLSRVSFVGQIPDNEQMYQWKSTYPEITFVWNFEVCGVSTNSLATELILNDVAVGSVENVESAYPYFYNLQKVELCRSGISSQELDELWKRHPETRVIWEVQVGRCTLRTDVISFMPYQFGYDGYRVLRDRDMGEMKYCVDIICMDMGHMEIADYSFLNYMPNMQYLILADTKGKDFSVLGNLKELKYLELFMLPFDQAEVLVGLTKLEDLNLGTTKIDNIEPLKQMTWLKHLWMPATKYVNGNEKRALINALPDTVINYDGAGSTGNGWRQIPNYYAMRDLLNMSYMAGK